MAYPSKKKSLLPEVVRLHAEGKTQSEIAEVIGVHYNTVCDWGRQEGLVFTGSSRGRPRGEPVMRDCDQCGIPMELTPAQAAWRRFCSRDCTNAWQREMGSVARAGHTCPCGEVIDRETRSANAKFCSPECRREYGKVGGPKKDPTRWVTFNCETCGEETTRYRKYGNGANRFCSNICASRWTRKVQHIGVDGIVLDSAWEALVWGICKFRKIPIERFDRAEAIEFGDGSSYGPDFVIPGPVYIEVKGFEDEDDRGRYEAWLATGKNLVVIGKPEIEAMLSGEPVEEIIRPPKGC